MFITKMMTILSVWIIGVVFVFIHVEAVTDEEFKSLLARLSVLEVNQAISDKRIASLETENKLFQKRITDLEQFKTLSDRRVAALKRENALCSRRNDAHDIVKKLYTQRKVVFETDKILLNKNPSKDKYDKSVRDGTSLKKEKILNDKQISPLKYDDSMSAEIRKAEIDIDEVVMVQRPTAVHQPEHRRFVAEGIVAFSAMKAATQDHVGIHQNIIFEQVLTNEGGGYHPNHSVFIAPQSGVYVLSSSITTVSNGAFIAEIVHNGNGVTRIYGHGVNTGHGQGSQTIVIKLNAGDEVAVQNVDLPNNSIFGIQYSSFSGYLLWPQ